MTQDGHAPDRAADLARAFDSGFAKEPQADGPASLDLLALDLGGDPYAVRLRETLGLFKDRRVTLLPGALPEFLGVAGIRGSVVAVYDLPALLGYPPATSRRWLLLGLAAEPVGLAFDTFEGQLAVPLEHVVEAGSDTGRPHVSQALRVADRLRCVIDVASIVGVVSSRARDGPPSKER